LLDTTRIQYSVNCHYRFTVTLRLHTVTNAVPDGWGENCPNWIAPWEPQLILPLPDWSSARLHKFPWASANRSQFSTKQYNIPDIFQLRPPY